MAVWTSKGGAFEYACSFSVDEAVRPLYTKNDAHQVVEVRSNFYFYAKKGEEKRWVGSERFGIGTPIWIKTANFIREVLGVRLRDYWMSPPQIDELLDAALLFSGPEGRPISLHLEVCSVHAQEEAEAMRPHTLRPLALAHGATVNPNHTPDGSFHTPIPSVKGVDGDPHPEILRTKFYEAVHFHFDRLNFLEKLYEEGVRVNDADEGAAVMQQCGVCGGKPFVGSVLAKLRCGHHFHYHCVVWPVRDRRACPVPVCGHPPYDIRPAPTPLPLGREAMAADPAEQRQLLAATVRHRAQKLSGMKLACN
ncbi:hypothetical protein OROGR_016524 [Orobanche gracilis]